ncbi:MAG: ABC transporter ATP-binding protein [Ruminococcus sp.]|nr:ABC transporter ATP-binding protein [Ruminococcus sp.]
MNILKVENLVKTYGEGDNKINAVDDVSFSVNKGEFVAIVGASGSGKSTLLHMIGGVDTPTSGKIFIDGKEINGMSSDKLAIFRRREVGIVYQFYNLIPILSVEENITLPCDLDGKEVDKERLEEILESFALSERRKNLPNELSGGQQQRTSIARALINNPAILLADEPTGNLDTKSTDGIMAILKMANRVYNQTIIMITHNMEIAKQADRILTISDGKIVEEAN